MKRASPQAKARPSAQQVAALQTELRSVRGQLAEAQGRLAEAEETLEAIRSGEVDALVVARPEGNQIFTLQGAETTYRFLVEEMNEGALLLGPEGTVLYANVRFAQLTGVPLEQVIGAAWERFFVPAEQPGLAGLLAAARTGAAQEELHLGSAEGGSGRPVRVSLCSMQRERVEGFSVVVTDLTERQAAEAALRAANEQLESRVQERTLDLSRANAQLQPALVGRARRAAATVPTRPAGRLGEAALPFGGSPTFNHTLFFLKNRFSWPILRRHSFMNTWIIRDGSAVASSRALTRRVRLALFPARCACPTLPPVVLCT